MCFVFCFFGYISRLWHLLVLFATNSCSSYTLCLLVGAEQEDGEFFKHSLSSPSSRPPYFFFFFCFLEFKFCSMWPWSTKSLHLPLFPENWKLNLDSFFFQFKQCWFWFFPPSCAMPYLSGKYLVQCQTWVESYEKNPIVALKSSCCAHFRICIFDYLSKKLRISPEKCVFSPLFAASHIISSV